MENRPSLEYDDPMRMPKLHALPVLRRKDSLAQAPPKILIDFFLYMYEIYSVCASLLCKSQKMMKQNKKRDEALQREEKLGGFRSLTSVACSFL